MAPASSAPEFLRDAWLSSVLVLVWLLPTPAHAGGTETLAKQAEAIHAKHCAKIPVDSSSVASKRRTAVNVVWGRIADRYERTPEPYLLYWRGVLAACLDQDDAATADLEEFVEQQAGDPTYAALVHDAQKRLSRRPGPVGRPGPAPGTVVGFISCGLLASTAAAFGVAAGSAAGDMAATEQEMYLGGQSTAVLDGMIRTGQEQTTRRDGLGISAVALGVGAVVPFVLSARVAGSRGPAIVATVVPTAAGGWYLAVAGRW